MTSQNLYNYLERINPLLQNEIRSFCKNYGLQPVQMEVLSYLGLCNKYSDTPTSVTEYLGLTNGTVSQTLLVLENKGFLKKTRDLKTKENFI